MPEKYEAGEDVLVFYGPMLFGAQVVDVQKGKDPYLVHFNGWHSRYDQWVSLDQMNKNTADNLKYQTELEALEKRDAPAEKKDAKKDEKKNSPKKIAAKEGIGMYKRINGIKFHREMINSADEAVSGKNDGVISIEDAKKLLKIVLDDDDYSTVERRTMRYIRATYKFTEKADVYTRHAITTWANQKHAKSASPKIATTPKKITATHKADIEKIQKGRKQVPSLIASSIEDIASYYDVNDEDVKASEAKFKKELRKAFRLFDANHNNMLEKDELAEMMRSMGRRPLQAKIDNIFEVLDEDGDGSIDFAEFLKYFKQQHAPLQRSASSVSAKETEKAVSEAATKVAKRKRETEDAFSASAEAAADALDSGEVNHAAFAQSSRLFRKQMREIFNLFDENNNNSISKKEVSETLKKMGRSPKTGKVDAIFLTLDADGGGTIDFDEFCKYFSVKDTELKDSNKKAKM